MSMSALAADNSKGGLVAQLEEVWDSLAVLGADLDDAGWATDTRCPGWPVSAQYAHIIGTESMILGRPNPDVKAPAGAAHVRNDIGGFNEVWVTALAAQPREEVLEAFAEVVSAAPGGAGRHDGGRLRGPFVDARRPGRLPAVHADPGVRLLGSRAGCPRRRGPSRP